jgi:hypothetical protein
MKKGRRYDADAAKLYVANVEMKHMFNQLYRNLKLHSMLNKACRKCFVKLKAHTK